MAENMAQIVAISPFTEENGGNYSKVIMENGIEIINKTKCTTVIKNLANKNCFDLEQFRKKSIEIFNRKLKIPIAMHPGLVLIPYKIREASFKDEGTNCYVNLLKIERIESIDRTRTKIYCTDGSIIEVLQTYNSVLNVKRMAKILREEQFESYREYM